MAKGKEYNGHRSWNAWNVSLWISNDEGLYRMAVDMKRRHKNSRAAANAMLDMLPATTPDGAKFNITSVTEALRDL